MDNSVVWGTCFASYKRPPPNRGATCTFLSVGPNLGLVRRGNSSKIIVFKSLVRRKKKLDCSKGLRVLDFRVIIIKGLGVL